MAWTANPRLASVGEAALPFAAGQSAHRDGVSDSDMGVPPSLQWDAEHRDHCGLAVSVRATFDSALGQWRPLARATDFRNAWWLNATGGPPCIVVALTAVGGVAISAPW